jgi:hypothetical protein
MLLRVGGGFMNFQDWVAKFGKKEGIIINETPLEGVGAHVLSSSGHKVVSVSHNNNNSNSQKSTPRKSQTTRVVISKRTNVASTQQEDAFSNTV